MKNYKWTDAIGQVMNYDAWRPIYEEIVREFGFDAAEDRRAAALLSSLLSQSRVLSKEALATMLRGREVCVIGGGVKLEDLSLINEISIAADGAVGILMKHGVVPEVIVTDLDGDVEAQVAANEKGSLAIIHAHGDNIELLKRWVPRFSGSVMGTTQTAPMSNMHNFGGFTDGDRAVLLADEMGARSISLVGFDFEHPAPKGCQDPDLKRRKLRWAARLVRMVKSAEVIVARREQSYLSRIQRSCTGD
ncbi:MAG: 6-hydroxymethylpterin diphosphokinase MptE-like protein [Candidatus Thermoplasmatota archaeon]